MRKNNCLRCNAVVVDVAIREEDGCISDLGANEE